MPWWWRGFFVVFRAFLRGVLRERGDLAVVFCGHNGGELWWRGGGSEVVFRGEKHATFLRIIFE
jgi:hypothetical protein